MSAPDLTQPAPNHFATITRTRFGYSAVFHERHVATFVGEPFPLTFDVGPPKWRFTRAGIERAAARVIRRRDERAKREAAAYEFPATDLAA